MPTLKFEVQFGNAARTLTMRIDTLVIAGWTGRDSEKVELHIRELVAIGVARPSSTPLFYRVANDLLTQEIQVQALGSDCTGEAEVVLIQSNGERFVGLGCDLTDRCIEREGVARAKQVCAKPVGARLWLLSELEDHWDALILRSFVIDASGRTLYQEGSVEELLTPSDLVARHTGSKGLPEGSLLFCGTLPVRGAMRSGTGFEMELVDPVLDRVLRHDFTITELDIVD